MVALLNVHPSRLQDLREEDRLRIEPEVPLEEYRDVFGNIATRFMAPPGADPPRELDADRGLGPARSDLSECPRGAGRRFTAGNAAVSDEQPVLRGRPAVADCRRALRRRAARLGARPGDLHVGEHEGDVQLPAGAAHPHGARRLHRARRRLPRLPAPRHHLLPRPEHPGAVYRRLSRRHRGDAAALADGFQRLVRGLPGGPLVDVRRPPQPGRASAASCSPPASTPPTSPSPRRSA